MPLLSLGLGSGKVGHKPSYRYWAVRASLQFECYTLDHPLYLRNHREKYVTEITLRSVLSHIQIAARMTVNEHSEGLSFLVDA